MDKFIVETRSKSTCRMIEITEHLKSIEDYGVATVYGIKMTEWRAGENAGKATVTECEDVSAIKEETIDIICELSKKIFSPCSLIEEISAVI